jgi:tRNA(fMet)-specific endonuclease VapC
MSRIALSHLLDTNICSYLMRARSRSVLDRLASLGPERVAVSVVTAIELREGAERSKAPTRYHAAIDAFLEEIAVLPLPVESAQIGGRLRADLRRQGRPIGDLDSLIAAHALALDLVLVTHNTREFSRVPELRLEDWA